MATDFLKAPKKKKQKARENWPPEASVKTRFRKGQSGNPSGRPSNPIPRALKNLTVATYREVIELVVAGNQAELDRMINDPTKSVLQVGIARAFRNALLAGDYETIERISERIVGKIPEVVQLSSENKNFNANAEVTKEQLRAVLAKLDEDV